MPAVAEILIPLALDTAYSYAVPPGLTLAEGDVVQVPLGPRETVGVVWGLDERASGGNLRPVTGRIEVPPLSEPLRKLVDWLARYTLAPKGSALAMALRLPDEGAQRENPRIGVRASGRPPPGRRRPGERCSRSRPTGRCAARARSPRRRACRSAWSMA